MPTPNASFHDRLLIVGKIPTVTRWFRVLTNSDKELLRLESREELKLKFDEADEARQTYKSRHLKWGVHCNEAVKYNNRN